MADQLRRVRELDDSVGGRKSGDLCGVETWIFSRLIDGCVIRQQEAVLIVWADGVLDHALPQHGAQLAVEILRRVGVLLCGADVQHAPDADQDAAADRVLDERDGRIPDFPVTRSHPPASWPSAANSSICRTYRKTAGEESRRRSPVANRWMRP